MEVEVVYPSHKFGLIFLKRVCVYVLDSFNAVFMLYALSTITATLLRRKFLLCRRLKLFMHTKKSNVLCKINRRTWFFCFFPYLLKVYKEHWNQIIISPEFKYFSMFHILNFSLQTSYTIFGNNKYSIFILLLSSLNRIISP